MRISKLLALPGLLAALLVIFGGADVAKGSLYIAKHEGDTLHLMQIVFEMAAGKLPHLDFMTPIGGLAFAPIALLVSWGIGIGNAILWAQILVATVFAPMIWWVAGRRLSPVLAAFFALMVMVLLLALVHGESQQAVSISMHYNRWAWAAAFVAILAAIIPPVRPGGTADGVIIALMMTAMLLIKVTYFAGFAPPVMLALWLTGQRWTLVVALIAGLIMVALLTSWLGPQYWLAYLRDLLTVAGSDIRAQPGEPLAAVLGAPAYLGGSMVAIAGVIFLRQAGVAAGGLILLTLLPGFFYVTFQNFGNDPQWLLLLGLLVLALRPVGLVANSWGWDMRQALGVTAAMALALAAPSFFNLAYSPYRHLFIDVAEYTPILPRGGINTDLQAASIRALRVDGRIAMDGPGSGLEAYATGAERDPLSTFMGETFPYCTTELGLPSVSDAIVRDLEAAGLAGDKKVFVADLLSSLWLFGDLRPLDHGAPWYYGGLPGYDTADYLLVPLCPVTQEVQYDILNAITERGTDNLNEIRRTPLYILFSKG